MSAEQIRSDDLLSETAKWVGAFTLQLPPKASSYTPDEVGDDMYIPAERVRDAWQELASLGYLEETNAVNPQSLLASPPE